MVDKVLLPPESGINKNVIEGSNVPRLRREPGARGSLAGPPEPDEDFSTPKPVRRPEELNDLGIGIDGRRPKSTKGL